MNITPILLKKVILEADSETWSRIRRNYLPEEYKGVYKVINDHFNTYGSLPSFDALRLSIRSDKLLNSVYAIEFAETVDVDNEELLEYLKNEYTQEEIMDQISSYLEQSIVMESAKENVDKLQQIILHVESKVELTDYREDMQRIELFDSEEELQGAFSLGLNAEFDKSIKFSPRDYILIGGRRGAGKSLTCSNIAVNEYEKEKSTIYFTIEMHSRSILQRMCSIATGVPAEKLKGRNLSTSEWAKVAKWWAGRFDGGEDAYIEYAKHKSFDDLHKDLYTRHSLKDAQLDIVYSPELTLANIRSELDKKVDKLQPSVILVDYINQVRYSNSRYSGGQYEWTEQIEISKALKAIAQEYEVPVVSPYQIDATGEARFAKGILDSADAAFILDPHNKDDECITFTNTKMRDHAETNFTSKINWGSLRIGPETAQPPVEEKKEKKSKDKSNSNSNSSEDVYDL